MSLQTGLLKMVKALTFATANLNFENVEAVNGDLLNISGREVGSEVMIGDGQPAPDGEIELTDGFKFIVKDGLIESVVDAPEVKEDAPEELETETEVVEEVKEVDEKDKEIEALKAELAELKAQLSGLSNEFKAIEKFATKEDLTAFQNEINVLSENIKLLASIPLEQSKVSQGFKSTNKKENDLKTLSEVFAKSK